MGKELNKITDKARYVEVYHTIMRAARMFKNYSPNIPRALIEVNQHIHGRFDEAAFYSFLAANETETKEKLKAIRLASNYLFYQYNSFDYLVNAKGITVGAADTVLDIISDAYEQLQKWESSLLKTHLQEKKAES